MNDINVNKAELLSVLRTNRDKHNAIFLEAQAGYREAVVKELDSMLAEARSGKKIRRAITLVEPVDQTKDYDRAIRMMEMSVDETIKLDPHDFQCYVMDEWQWKNQFMLSNVGYSKTLQDSL